jgi:hypothetical protein
MRRPLFDWWLQEVLGQTGKWNYSRARGVQQQDAFSCGVITCMTILSICLGIWPSLDIHRL